MTFPIGSKVRLIYTGGLATVVKATPHDHKKKGKRVDGTIVDQVFLQLDDEPTIRFWLPTDRVRSL